MLDGKRIYLRRFQVTDAPVLLKWGQNHRYHRLAGFEVFNNLQEAKKGAQEYANRKNSFALCLKENNQLIGLVELYERGLDEASLLKTKEIGFMLEQDFEGHGYMTEALKLVLHDAFEQMGQTEIWAGTFDTNFHSQEFLERIGFKYVYTTDYAQISNLFSYKEKYYLLKKEEWLKMVSNTKS